MLFARVLCLGCLTAAFAVSAGEEWRFANVRAWARDKGTASAKASPEGGWRFVHSGQHDWALNGIPEIAARPGDIFEFSVATAKTVDDAARLDVCAIVRWADGREPNWMYARKWIRPGGRTVTRFMVPDGAVSVTPRVIGGGVADFRLVEAVCRRTERRDVPAAGRTVAFTNDTLVVSIGVGGALTVSDRRTGRVWRPIRKGGPTATDVRERLPRLGTPRLEVSFLNPETLGTLTALVAADPTRPGELTVTLIGGGDLSGELAWPPPFAAQAGDRMVLPINEGMGFPVDEPYEGPRRMITYGGHGLCMAFFGIADDASGAGWMAIVETPDDAACQVSDAGGCVTPGVVWEPQKQRWGYARRLRFVFFDRGGHVAMAKRYRAYAKENGLLKTFDEKIAERPLVRRLLGAPNVWCWDGDKIGVARMLADAGITHYLWSGGGTPQEVAHFAALPDVLVGRYDIYQDVYHPDVMKAQGRKGTGLNGEAWPQDIMWSAPDSNAWRRAWAVKDKSGNWVHTAMMCDRPAVDWERRRVTEELRRIPYNARFIDTTVAAPWHECWNPAHPLTRTESKFWKMELLRVLGDEYGLVVGSETGHDASVPYCDYYEGMLSVAPFRVPDSGRNIQQVWTNSPARTAKYMVGEKYRLPLWELVYHDCVCAHWYWGDYNNKLLDLWEKRDLFNVLYGTAPMFVVSRRRWAEEKDRLVKTYRLTEPVARHTGASEMLGHEILRGDRTLQRTRFADGTAVTVDFRLMKVQVDASWKDKEK